MNYRINIILNSILLGIILLTQFLNYPLFKKVNADFDYHSGAIEWALLLVH